MNKRRRVNLKFLLALMLSVAAVGVGVHFVHGYQVKRQASALRLQAEIAEEDQDVEHAIGFLERFLGYNPGDTDALAKYGELLDDAGKAKGSIPLRHKALAALEEVLRREPERRDVRRKQVDLALEVGEFASAVAHAKILLEPGEELTESGRAELEQRVAQAEELRRQYKEAEKWYGNAIGHAPGQPDLYLRLAGLYRFHLDAAVKADALMAGMIEKIEKSVPADQKNKVLYEAYFARARYYISRFAGEAGTKRGDLEKLALENVVEVEDRAEEDPALAGSQVEQFLLWAELFQAQRDSARAGNILRKGVAAWPKDVRLSQALARHEAATGEFDQALALIRTALEGATDKEKTSLRQDLADWLIQRGGPEQLNEAKGLIAELRASKHEDQRSLDYLEARLHAQNEEWGKAAQILSRLGPQLAVRQPLQAKVYLLLGICYERLLNPDQALLAYQQSLKLEPVSLPALRGLASMFLALDRLPDSLREYRHLLAFDRHPLDTRVLVARLLILAKLRLPPDKRGPWDEVERELNLATQELDRVIQKDPMSADAARLQADVTLLQAQVMLLKDPQQIKAAREFLQEAVKVRPGEVALWVGLARLQDSDKDPSPALAILQEAEQRLPKEADQRLARARRLELRLARLPYLAGLPEAGERLKKEEEALREQPGEGRFLLLMGLAEAYSRIGDSPHAELLWTAAANERPGALVPRLVRLDQAMRAGNDAEVKGLLEDIRRIEGPQGTFWLFGEASRRCVRAQAELKQGQPEAAKKLLAEARGYLDDAGRQRPSWSHVPALRGEMATLEGKAHAAVECYQQAVSLGDRRPQVLRRLVETQLQLKRYADAAKVVQELQGQDQAVLSSGLGRLASLTKLSSGDRVGALQLAKQAVDPKSKDPTDHVLLGLVIAAAGRDEEAKKEAEKEFRLACELAGADPDPWVWLVSFLAGSGQKAQAEKAIDDAQKKLPPERSSLALAACYAIVSKGEQAEKCYQKALQEKPDDALVLHSVAAYYMQSGQPQKAAEHLRKLLRLTSGEEQAWVRRTLALAMGSTIYRQPHAEALALVEENLRANGNSVPDLRAKALLLATRSYERGKAIGLLEDVRGRDSLTPDEQFTLFRLYEADGKWPEAQRTMLLLLESTRGRENAAYRAGYVRRLVRRDEIDEAGRQFDALRRVAQGEGAGVDPFLLREAESRILRAQGKHDEAVGLLRAYSANAKDADLLTVAQLVDEFSQSGDAGGRYRSVAEDLYMKYSASSKSPQRGLVLAEFYGRQARTGEAIRYCLQAADDKASPTAVGRTMVASLRAGEDKAKQYYPGVEQWLQKAAKEEENAEGLMLALADFRDLQGTRQSYQEAEALYATVLRTAPNNLLAINNLAWLLAVNEGRGEEALALVNRGIDLVGPSAELLDTRGCILVRLGRASEAIKVLQESLDQSPSPARYFHIAQAQLLAKDRQAARLAMNKAAVEGRLQPKELHALEREAYLKLRAELDRA
jgi:predicted Zn-dependent protease